MPGVPLYERGTGKPVDLAPEEAQAAVLSGAVAPLKDQKVAIRLADGRRWDIEGHELHTALSNGATLLDPDAERHAKLVEDTQGAGGTAAALGLGAFTGATVGLGPGIVRKGIAAVSGPQAGRDFEEAVNVNREVHNIANPVGEVAGAAGAAFASGGESLAAEGAAGLGARGLARSAARLAPAAAVDAVGGAAERLTARAVAGIGGEGLVGTAVRKGATTAARAAAETSLFSMGAELGEEHLGDHEAAWEKIAIAGGEGLGMGLLLGGTLGAGGSFLAAGKDASLKGLRGLFTKAADDATAEGEMQISAAQHTAPDGTSLGLSHEATAGEKLIHDAEQIRALSKQNVHPDLAADMAFKAANPSNGIVKEAEARAGGTTAVGHTVLREGVLDTGQGLLHNTPENMLERTQSALERVGKEIGEVVGPSQGSVSAGEILAKVDDIIAPHAKSAFSQVTADSLNLSRQRLVKTLGLLDAKGEMIPGALEKRIPLQDLVRERRVGEALDNAAKAAGGGPTGAQFKALNKTMQHLYIYEKALENTIAGSGANRAVSLTDHIVGKGAALLGGAVGGMVAGPLGVTVGGVASGATGALLNKLARERGNAAAAVAITRLSNIGAIQHMIGKVDKSLDQAAKGLVASERKSLRVVGGSARVHEEKPQAKLGARYRDAIKELDAMNASNVPGRAQEVTKDLSLHAPKVANAYVLGMSAAAAYLESKRPQPLGPPGPFTQHPPSVPDTDKSSYVRTHEAVNHPQMVIDHIAKGVVIPEEIDALKAIAPKTYAELQGKVMSEVASHKASGKPLPFEKCMKLSLIFDIPAADCMQKDIFKALQSNVASPPSAGNKPGKGRSGPVKLPNSYSALDNLSGDMGGHGGGPGHSRK